jgi:hypothetical protein
VKVELGMARSFEVSRYSRHRFNDDDARLCRNIFIKYGFVSSGLRRSYGDLPKSSAALVVFPFQPS